MKDFKPLWCLLFIFLGFKVTIAQTQTQVSGSVVDPKENLKLANATVMLLQAKDSILVSFTRTDANGSFVLKNIPSGDYLFISSYPNYGDFYKSVLVDGQALQLGNVELQSRAQLLEEVIITGRIPIVMKGDTTEYDAGSFTVEKNAKVEDLLKVLPGISVDASGKITAQGKTVEKVLVDGEEFFGDDPTFATRNLRSDMIDKVQVYEKKSDLAEKTGVEDGEKIQTINLTLKEDAKNGMFGKAVAGIGNDGYYEGQAMLNKFKGSQKASAFLTVGNNGTNGLSFSDAQKFGDANEGVSFEDGGVFIVSGGNAGQGIPTSLVAGFSFSDKWNQDKHKLNANYKYGNVDWKGFEDVNTQNNMANSIFNTKSYKTFKTEERYHKFNFKYDLQLDSLKTLTITANAGKGKTNSTSKLSSEMSNGEGQMLNTNTNNQNSERNTDNFNLAAYYGQKFMKKSRFLSVNAKLSESNADGENLLYSYTEFYKLGVQDSSSLIDQLKISSSKTRNYGMGLSYTEPISKRLNLTAAYNFERTTNDNLLNSFNKAPASGDYSILDSTFSNDYNFSRNRHAYNLGAYYYVDKFNLTLTNRIFDDQLSQENRYNGMHVERKFLTYNPLIRSTYNISKNKSIRFNYTGSNGIPSLTQIQPLRDNTDPLNIYLGNENLKPSFTNNVNLSYNTYSVLKAQYMFLGLNGNLTNNALIQNIRTTAEGVSTYKWENLTDENNMFLSFYGGFNYSMWKKHSVMGEVWADVSTSTNHNFVNEDLNEVNSNNYNLTYTLSRSKASGFDFRISATPGYRTMKSNLQPENDNNGFTFRSYSDLTYFLPKKFKFNVVVNYSYEAPTKAFDEKFETLIINPRISKKFLKSDALEVGFTVNDLLNQNVGFRRTQTASVFQQRRFQTIQRYFMLNLTWDFTKMFIKN